MSRVSARSALQYAISPSMLRLFGVVLLGWLLLSFGIGLLTSGPITHGRGGLAVIDVIQWSLGIGVSLVGLLALYGGLAALLYKIVVEALADAGVSR